MSDRQPRSVRHNLFTVATLAEYLRVPESFVYRLVTSHRIAFLKVGGELCFRSQHVADYIESLIRGDVPVRRLAHADAASGGRPEEGSAVRTQRRVETHIYLRSGPQGDVYRVWMRDRGKVYDRTVDTLNQARVVRGKLLQKRWGLV